MDVKITSPGGFVPAYGTSFSDAEGSAVTVDQRHPLPVALTHAAAAPPPLSGSTSTSRDAGPFVPDLGRPIWVELTGEWTGTVELRRSSDQGATRLPLTIAGESWGSFTRNCNEPVATESAAGAQYWLAISLTSGTLTYRVSQ